MKGESDQPEVDVRLAAVAARQYGVVTRGQLRCLGVGETGIEERLRTRRLHRLYRGVYAVGHRVLRAEAHRMAAVLACGEGAVLSHLDAGAHWQIRQSSSGLIHVTVPVRSGRRGPNGIRIHRSGRLGPEEVTVHEGIPTTTVARTLLDLADVLSPQALKRAIDEADYRNLFDLTALIAVVEANPGRRAKKVMRALEGPQELTRSALEDRFIAFVERHALPRPRVNAWVAGHEVDFLWPQARLIVETDGRDAHGTRAAVHRDRAKDLKLRQAGYTVRRYSATQLRYDEEAIAAELAALLSDERASSNPPPSRSSTSPASAR
jgi:very-short-patch-repair endonuclease